MASSLQKYPGGARSAGAEPPSPGLLRIDTLRVEAGQTALLKGISLDLAQGETLALTGESGSGKSMTSLAIMGLLPPGLTARGRIEMDGRNLLTLSEPALCSLRGREIGMVFQEPMTALNPLMPIGAQVAETVRQHDPSQSKAQARAQAIATLGRCGLDPDRIPPTRFPHELSGGQRQRVVIALAIAARPRLLIADEPTTALDVTTQAQILALLKQLAAEDGMALILITHDLAVVAGMADRIAVMQQGEIVETGPTAEVFREMRHPYTRALFQASSHRADLPPPTASGPLLQVTGVCRSYPLPRRLPFAPRRAHPAVTDVSFAIHQGERVGLVGESGSGKSTLTRALLGLERVQGGSITLDGQPIGPDAPPALRRHIQVVFQDPYGSFNPRHKVARLIAEPFHLLPDAPQGTARRDAIAEALTAVGLNPDDMHKHIHAFSGGQRQRIAIARALVIKPRLILFDEAVSALDVRVRAQILDLIAGLSRTYGLAWLFISHDLTVVRSITDRVLVMQNGRIVEQGQTETVLSSPEHPYTRALIAAAPRLPDIGDFDAA